MIHRLNLHFLFAKVDSQLQNSCSSVEKSKENVSSVENSTQMRRSSRKRKLSQHLCNEQLEKERVKCNLCEKTFSTAGHLKAHVQRKHENRPKVQCRVDGCTKSFATDSNRNRHEKTLHENKPNCADFF